MSRYVDVVPGVVCLVLSVLAFLATNTVQSAVVVDTLGPAGYPRFLAVLFAAFSVALLLQGLFRRRPPQAPRDAVPDEDDTLLEPKAGRSLAKQLLTVAGILALGAVYVAILHPLGYLAATPILLVPAMVILGARQPRQILLATVVLVAALYLLFGLAMRVPLPAGFWTE